MITRKEILKSFKNKLTSWLSSYPTRHNNLKGLPSSSIIFKIISMNFKLNSGQPETNFRHQDSTYLFIQKLWRSLALEDHSSNPPKLGIPDERNHSTVGKRMSVLQITKRSRSCQTVSLLLHQTSPKQLHLVGIPCQLSRPLKWKNGIACLTNRRKQQKKPRIMPVPPRNSFLIIHQSFKTIKAISK